ncbi:uncharacterized protein LOC123408372 [Hordeum vulgare subsp. vulgare]|uniref:Uncharacterized protein n=2 Tax=Hordeum vulgare subsp. vulgare TaxID=112509 RepID=A0A8I6YES8_HORVV|nr:uncharacterized protein LOC123408372 [Hordeum vulgare subsp. vulgare]XP_044957427.1 uncharacterized protein LOC123408372 [Hordeum vulgare subsp. vulgare]XP_044957428.1 uncharacterized protein LOC123408372 [Hordeum vulgare subsp. vulgare]XP_044957429.1 uncharacterized protein LOC123408372 [Hordeum vulgare subsp. vulgare]XP_044957430.1 uncharacterized protein LOC123408372 [Hordeum vulgare subsp. vulgare]XP_044957431.1 uncharacterized protein LOC123408372 [Hordeum vulgare subsp. vulgare]
MDPFVSDPTEPVKTSPQTQTQGQEEEGLGADPSFNSSYTESVGATAATQADDEAESRAPGSPSPPRRPPSISSRRDPIRAGCFRRLAASCEAARIREAALLRESKPPAAKAEDPDEPIWPPKSPHWRRYVELQTMGSSPSNPVPNPDENSLSHPPRKESQYMLADKVVDQWDDSDTENSSGSASYQIVYYKNAQGENTFLVPPKKRKFTIDTYAVECSTCQKWRIIPSKLKYEQIRENIIHVPFSCKYVHGWKPEVTCHDPTDISEGNGMVWAIDKPAIPQTPPGWERKITLRSEQGTRFADVYYICPAGRKLRSMKEVERCFEDNPDYAAVLQLSQFSFKVPKPPNRPRQSELIEPTEVPPPVHRVPVHNYMPVPHGEANPLTHIPVTLALQVPVMRSKKRKLNQ